MEAIGIILILIIWLTIYKLSKVMKKQQSKTYEQYDIGKLTVWAKNERDAGIISAIHKDEKFKAHLKEMFK